MVKGCDGPGQGSGELIVHSDSRGPAQMKPLKEES